MAVPFDRKKAITDIIAAMVMVQQANARNLSRAQQQLVEAEESAKGYHMMDGYVKGEIAKLVEIKRKIEEEEKQL